LLAGGVQGLHIAGFLGGCQSGLLQAIRAGDLGRRRRSRCRSLLPFPLVRGLIPLT